MNSTFSALLSKVGILFSPIFDMVTGSNSMTIISSLIIFSIGLTIVGSVLHFLLART